MIFSKLKHEKYHSIFNKYIFNILKYTLKIFRLYGVHSWPTKSYEIWFLIQFLLINERPNKLVEIGSGRSTHYIAEYSQKYGKEFYSIEQNFIYIIRNWIGLRCSFIKKFNLIFVPIKGDWFDIRKLKSLEYIRNADFLLIDGPGGTLNKGSRSSQNGLRFLKQFYPKTASIIIDDIHRKEIKIFSKEFISNRNDFFYMLLKYNVNSYHVTNNLILFCIKKKNKEKYLKFLKFTSINEFLMFQTESFDELYDYLNKDKNYIVRQVMK